ncbi:acetyl-CoA carboxylase biotin carboxylase subunit [Streptomyces antnestii]|uniref:biotin carboxylase n=1 Tax=Streptomyces antnestii TaxID=2494256 RepID=A0A437Q3A2_9ACTN|nr:biotin carboxylase N-terminal domain-containing protein [Streptomyces sp. San01]RVU29022.1 acetyl-CoA carboxylase biotin carboxylase subunit [Streptomyces sp. San01]
MTEQHVRYFNRVLVANRGEIALRVIRTLQELSIASVAVYSDADTDSAHVVAADHAVHIGGSPVAESYLRIDRIIEAALSSGADAIHPGYGLLSENPDMVEACERAGLVWIGPSASAMRAMGSKLNARRLMIKAGVPVVPGGTEPIADEEAALAAAESLGYPVAFKASGAGGGKGFRVAHHASDVPAAFTGAAGEGERFFGDPTVYAERYLANPRHVEVQILADQHGSVIHLHERDCSVQRRHQKLVEEAPAPAVSAELRAAIGEIAIAAARSTGYVSAGTIEGLLDGDQFYFLEMNTRIQVEHPVTEMITGVDIVAEQLRIAAGHPLTLAQEAVRLSGHAIECRINAENAAKNFLPSPVRIGDYREPSGEGVRVDSGVRAGDAVHQWYDPLIAKLVVWAEDRDAATDRMLAALRDFTISGPATLLPFHAALLSTDQWRRGETCADLLADRAWLRSTAG